MERRGIELSENINNLIEKASSLGLKAYPLESRDIAVENRIALKCAYGCRSYGKRLSCPPHIISIDEFRKVLQEYSNVLLLVEEHDTSGVPDVLEVWGELRKESFQKMFELEQEAFRKGFIYAQLLRPGSCNECAVCNLEKCIKPELRRFAPEAVGINLQKVMESAGTELEFCKPEKTLCVGILLVE
jgi:predicted metal-binding protein